MERVLERGHGKSPGAMPHFGRIASEVVAKANKVEEVGEGRVRGRVLLNYV